MASTGRGRGRGRGLLARELPDDSSSKPGGLQQTDSKVTENGDGGGVQKVIKSQEESLAEIQEILDGLMLDIPEQTLNNIYELAENTATSDEDIKKMTSIVYRKCVSDREFAKTGAYICEKLASLEANGTKFRSTLLGLIQADFKQKDELRSKSASTFLNVLSFMCQIFGTMRTAGGEVFKPLVSPLHECFSIILDSDESNNDEFECLNIQLQAIGKDLEQSNREKMCELMDKIRDKIIRKGASPPVRCALLEVVECSCRGWKELPNDVTRFYCDTMMDIITD